MRQPETDNGAFRETEIEAWKRTGARPSSIFDISGIDSVGALALNGMLVLREMPATNVLIWPFDDFQADSRICVEIFPRALWAAVNPGEDPRSKKNKARRQAFIEACREDGFPVDARVADTLVDDERAFDSFLTAWALSRYGGGLADLEILALAHLEGQIWLPSGDS